MKLLNCAKIIQIEELLRNSAHEPGYFNFNNRVIHSECGKTVFIVQVIIFFLLNNKIRCKYSFLLLSSY